MKQRQATPKARLGRTRRSLKVGFVPLIDAAPLVVAQERGFFARYDLRVELSRELGWATIRDKVIYGELDAAHAVAGMPLAATFGLGSIACDCLTALVLNLHGNAITLSRDLYDRGVRDAATLKKVIDQDRGTRTYHFGVVYPFSSHHFLLREWLRSGQINPDKDVRIVVVPPPQMFANLKAGNLDGYCVGEPWNSMAVQNELGWVVATSVELAPRHPEKVLMVRRTFGEDRPEEHVRLIAALMEACAFCDQMENREEVAQILSLSGYLNISAHYLRQSLVLPFDCGLGKKIKNQAFHCFFRDQANEPGMDKASWVINHFLHSGVMKDPAVMDRRAAQKVFSLALFEEARELFETYRSPFGTPLRETDPVLDPASI